MGPKYLVYVGGNEREMIFETLQTLVVAAKLVEVYMYTSELIHSTHCAEFENGVRYGTWHLFTVTDDVIYTRYLTMLWVNIRPPTDIDLLCPSLYNAYVASCLPDTLGVNATLYNV